MAILLQRVAGPAYRVDLAATGADLRATVNPIAVRLTFGDDQGDATATALIRR